MMMLAVMFTGMPVEGDHQQFLAGMKKYHFHLVNVFHDISLLTFGDTSAYARQGHFSWTSVPGRKESGFRSINNIKE